MDEILKVKEIQDNVDIQQVANGYIIRIKPCMGGVAYETTKGPLDTFVANTFFDLTTILKGHFKE